MMLSLWNGVGSLILRVILRDTTLTNNGGKTGLTFSSTGLVISTIADNEASATAYTQSGSTIETITTLGTFAAPTATKCRFREVDSTNHPGLYEIQIANARWAVSGARYVVVTISGVSGVTQENYLVQLPTTNLSDGTNSATPAVPSAAAGANGGLPVLSSGGTTLAYTVSTLTTYTGNTPQTGDAYARLGAPAGASVSADIAAVKADTAGIASLPSAAAITTAVLTTTMTESYAALHAAPTLAQAVFEVVSMLSNRSISGTTLTTKKVDGSTSAMTFTLDSATTPTSQLRAS